MGLAPDAGPARTRARIDRSGRNAGLLHEVAEPGCSSSGQDVRGARRADPGAEIGAPLLPALMSAGERIAPLHLLQPAGASGEGP